MQNKVREAFPVGSMSAKEFVTSTYNPRVGVVCSPAAESLVKKNNLKFTQLIMPFAKLKTEVYWMEPSSGQKIIPRSLRITPVDITTWKPSIFDSQRNRKILNNAVAQNVPPIFEEDESKFQSYKLGGEKSCGAEYKIEVPASTPWFDSWRETFIRLHSEAQISQHEFLHHFMACILVMSSTEGNTTDELANTVLKLSKLQQQHQSEWPTTWAFSSVLKFYLVLHETSGDQTSADAMYQSLRTTYGGNFCYMLQLKANSDENSSYTDPWSRFVHEDEYNSKEDDKSIINVKEVPEDDIIVKSDLFHPLSPDSEKSSLFVNQNGEVPNVSKDNGNVIIRGKHLSADDLKNIQTSVNEFISKALLPYMERQSRILHESIVNRRGMSKSFFSATKRLFGSGAKAASSVFYASDSLEMMSRKLADVYFLFGHYAGAYHLYHQLKKDFLADSAWVYSASSLEMAAVSHFMMSQNEPPLADPRAFPVHYIGDALNHYIDHCRNVDSATKCTLICCDCLKQLDNNGEAAATFIRMTSEECDLRSALMLEQAAYAFLRLNSPRKYALHCVLAGHRYSKAGLKRHSLNCYLQASQVYSGKGWRFAEDHVHFTIARHQSNLQMTKGLSNYLQSLLVTPTPQPSYQIQIFYKEYLSTMAKHEEQETCQEFFIPNVVFRDIVVRTAVSSLPTGEIINAPPLDDELFESWDALEEKVIKEYVKNPVIAFKPSKMIFHSGSDNTINPYVPCNETFYVELPLKNPLSIAISLRNIRLSVEGVDCVNASIIQELELQPEETKTIRFSLRASTLGTLCFDGIFYELELLTLRVPFKQKIVIKGVRLNSTKAERIGRIYAKDLRNQIIVEEKMPLLQAHLEGVPSSLYHSQSTEFQIVLSDKSLDSEQKDRIEDFVIAMDKMQDCLEIHSSSGLNSGLTIESVKKNFTSCKASFNSASTCRIPCIFRAPQSGEFAYLNLLILYRFHSVDANQRSRTHRIAKICLKVSLANFLKLEYSTLKLLNARKSIGLIRTHNLTPDRNIFINKVDFDHQELKIDEFHISTSESSRDESKNCVQLGPMESRNIIVKVVDTGDTFSKTEDISLAFHWMMQPFGNNHAVNGCSRIIVADIKNILSLEENCLIFELKHESRSSHDFTNNPCHMCPIELLVHSKMPGKISLQMEKNPNVSTMGPGLKASGDELFFVGQTCWVLNVSPMNTYKLEYKIAVTRPGIYNTAPTLIATIGEDANAQRKYVLHSPLIVAQFP